MDRLGCSRIAAILRRLPVLALLFLIFSISLCTSQVQAQEKAVGRIVNFKGTVQTNRPDSSAWENASVGQLLEPGDNVRTGSDGWAALLLSDETLIQLNRNSVFALKEVAVRAGWSRLRDVVPAAESSARSKYRLQSGEVWLRNKNQGAVIDVETPSITAGLRGTELNLSVGSDQTSILTVLEGLVSAWNEFGSEKVGPQEQVIARPGMAPQKRVLLTPEDAVQWTISVPAVFGPQDFPLINNDRSLLTQEAERLKKLASIQTQSAEVSTRLGQVQRDLGLPEEASASFEKSLTVDPRNPEALTGLGWTLIDRYQPEKALDCFAKVQNPGPMTYLGQSVALSRLDSYDRARHALKQGLSRYPDFLHFQLLDAFLDLMVRDLNRARETLMRLSTGYPDYSPAWRLLAVVELSRGDNRSAFQSAERGVQAAPHSPNALIIESYTYQALFDLDRAQIAARKALELDERNVLALVNLAKLLFGSDYTDEAWKVMEKAEKLAPDDAEVQNMRGFLLLAQRRTEQAISAFKRSIRSDPGLGEPHLGMALAVMRMGDMATATEEITTAILLEPRRSLFLSYWAKMLYQLKRFDQALDALSVAGKLDPRDPTPELYKGIILRDLNRPTEAIEAVNRAIVLNDNRAVYNSRFILDRDLAVKSVDLSILYNQLGLSSWAANKAQASVKRDYTNYAGHIFLAGGYFQEGEFGRVAASEALLGRMLMPANLNSFNTYNGYTSFFESPSINATVSGTIGNFDTYNANAVVYGAVPQINTAFSASVNYQETDGWRGTNFQRSFGQGGIVKWDLTPTDGIMVASSHLNSKQGDRLDSRFEFSSHPEPFDLNKSELTRYELGYNHHFAPNNDLLLYFTRFDINGDGSIHDAFRRFFPDNTFADFDSFGRFHFLRPFYQAQGQYHFKLGDHQLIVGTVHYWGENGVKDVTKVFLRIGNELFPFDPLNSRSFNQFDNTLHSYYVKDIWQIASNVILEGAAYVDQMHQSNAFTGTEWDFTDFNPRLGLIWTPTKADTFRLAAFRTRLPFDSNRIDPLEVAGVPIFRNTLEGARADEVDATWEHEWATGFASANLFYLERDFPFKLHAGQGSDWFTQHGHLRGVRTRFNQLLWKGFGLTAEYAYNDVQDDNLPQQNRKDHRITSRLNFLHPTGISVFLAETYRYEDFDDSTRSNVQLWITDIGIGYEFPKKIGSVSFSVQNLFDRHFDWVTDNFIFVGRVPRRQFLGTVTLNF